MCKNGSWIILTPFLTKVLWSAWFIIKEQECFEPLSFPLSGGLDAGKDNRPQCNQQEQPTCRD